MFRPAAGSLEPGGPASADSPGSGDIDLPAPGDLDLLVVMGGPMNVYQHADYPWLLAERALIGAAIDHGKAMLGICLGAQLIADVLGGPVTSGPHPEIGWYPVELSQAGRAHPAFSGFPPRYTALHWHGDMFGIPPGTIHVASSRACPNQAFATADGRVVGLQFHLEETPDSLAALVENAGGDLGARPQTESWVASRDELLAPDAPYGSCRELLFSLLDRMADAAH
jgi:GMP synthase-like glutamine amidotransferase